MLPLLLVLFIVVPIVELYVILQVGQAIGVVPTIALLIADSILGSVLMRSQGRAAWRRFNAAVAEGRVPHREVLDAVLVIFGGALLLTPGFATDLLGVLLLLPPTRAVIRGVLVRRLLPRMVVSGLGGMRRAPRAGSRDGFDRRARPTARPRDADVEGSAAEVDDPRRLP
ncbi:MAG TPA: FxsA family protein [Solirubrobacteraceae bacterium]|nr:FxsA family protein [Solirubrobacteraceae bacterium]